MKIKLLRSSILLGFVEAVKSGSVIESDHPEAIAEYNALIKVGLAKESTEKVNLTNKLPVETLTIGKPAADITEDDDDLLALLTGTVGEVTESLDALDTDGLKRLAVLENRSEKPRKGVLEAIEAAIAAANDE